MRFLGDWYVGFVPRIVYELKVISEALKRGVPVAEPMGAIIENIAPAVYRGAIITKAIPGMTFWEFVQNETDPRSLSHVVRMARYSIDIMHEHGIFHDDLNMQNLFVSMAGDGFSVVILDFDKAKVTREARFPREPGGNATIKKAGAIDPQTRSRRKVSQRRLAQDPDLGLKFRKKTEAELIYGAILMAEPGYPHHSIDRRNRAHQTVELARAADAQLEHR